MEKYNSSAIEVVDCVGNIKYNCVQNFTADAFRGNIYNNVMNPCLEPGVVDLKNSDIFLLHLEKIGEFSMKNVTVKNLLLPDVEYLNLENVLIATVDEIHVKKQRNRNKTNELKQFDFDHVISITIESSIVMSNFSIGNVSIVIHHSIIIIYQIHEY